MARSRLRRTRLASGFLAPHPRIDSRIRISAPAPLIYALLVQGNLSFSNIPIDFPGKSQQ